MNPDQVFEARKQQIARQFGRSASAYSVNAKLQYQGAQHLLNLIQSNCDLLPAGDILEVGCGTGFITQGLVECFADRSLEITDLSLQMLDFCQQNLVLPIEQADISFYCLDAESHRELPKLYASIVGGFVVQWFNDIRQSIANLISQLHPGGILFLSFPGSRSFPEWQEVCEQLGLPFTANPLPDPDLLLAQLVPPVRVLHVETVDRVTRHVSAAAFFQELKAIGAGVSQQRLSAEQMRRLIRGWDAKSGQASLIEVHHQIVYLALQRIS